MKCFAILIAIFGFVNCQTNQQFSDRTIRNINGTLPSIRYVVQAQVRPFDTDIRSGVANLAREQAIIMFTFGVLSPTPEFSDFANNNLKAVSTYNDTIDGTTSNVAIARNFEGAVSELRTAVINAFQQAPKIENQTLACRFRLVPAVNLYTHRLQMSALGITSRVTIKFIQNATDERRDIRNAQQPFFRNLTICNGRFPLETRRTCITNLIAKDGPAFTDLSRSIGSRIKAVFERAYKEITDQLNALAKTVQPDLMKAMNASCPKLT